MWNATLLMINLAGLAEARGEGVDPAGDSEGVGSVLGDVMTAGSDGLVSGEFDACCWGAVQLAETNTRPANVTTDRHQPQFIVLTPSCGKV